MDDAYAGGLFVVPYPLARFDAPEDEYHPEFPIFNIDEVDPDTEFAEEGDIFKILCYSEGARALLGSMLPTRIRPPPPYAFDLAEPITGAVPMFREEQQQQQHQHQHQLQSFFGLTSITGAVPMFREEQQQQQHEQLAASPLYTIPEAEEEPEPEPEPKPNTDRSPEEQSGGVEIYLVENRGEHKDSPILVE
jgi:hypothetical protein